VAVARAGTDNLNRLPQFILIGSTGLGSWLGMQAVHELGHVTGARLTGGRVAHVTLHPLTISRTDLAENPHPLIVVWSGPIVGVVLPLVLWVAGVSLRFRGAFVLRFFAGFCYVANGLYIGLGSFARIGDCGEMLNHGSQAWQLWLFGVLAAPAGFCLWHRQGANFGLGSANGQVDRHVAYGTLIACIALAVIGFAVGE
jgi:hypothetical protein